MTAPHPFSNPSYSSWNSATAGTAFAPARAFGHRLARGLLVLGVLAGGVVALARNDLLLKAAQSLGFEAKYLSFESASLGGPGWGTPRSLAPLTDRSRAWFEHLAAPETGSAGVDRVPTLEPSPAPARAILGKESDSAAHLDSKAARALPSNPATAADGVKIVSLDALPLLEAKPSTSPAAPRAAQAPAAAAVSNGSKPPATASLAAREATAAKPAAVRSAATVVAKREEKATVEPRPRKIAAAPPAPAAPDNPLKAAIRSAILKESNP